MEPSVDDVWRPDPAAWQPRPKFRDRVWLHALLFVLTIVSTTAIGSLHYLGFVSAVAGRMPRMSVPAILVHGFWYSGTVLGILGCHELGHYLACRYYNIDASLPFFLPIPLPPSGTLGAFIRIREPIPLKRMLFDIGIAGPIAGFLVAVPTLFIGVAMSRVMHVSDASAGTPLGEPLLLKLASHLLWGNIPEGYDLNTHPMAFGAWFGLLATALNLFPIGQLDGGHISYTVLGRKSSTVSLVGVAAGIVMSFISPTWIVWTVLMIAMLRVFGRHHPRVIDEDVPLDRSRMILAAVALIIFIVCFIPVPFPT
ncbi:MAG TPA: site-2 protease family protein [Vicinamibacterales bacterium]